MKKMMVLVCMLVLTIIIAGCSEKSNESNVSSSAPEAQTSAVDTAKSEPIEKPVSDFPTKRITMVIPYAPGGSNDTFGRIIAKTAEKYLGQTIVIENKEGGAASIGANAVAKSAPDGHTLFFSTTSPLVLFTQTEAAQYKHTDFKAIARATIIPQVLFVHADSPYTTFEEWLEFVKQNPGKFSIGITGIGNTTHLAIEALQKAEQVQTKLVPYSGGAEQLVAVLGGHVDGMVSSPFNVDMTNLRALVNFGHSKGMYTDIPTLQEKGIDVSVDTPIGIYAPAGVPEDVLAILTDAFDKAINDQEVIDQFIKMKFSVNFANHEVFEKEISDAFEIYGKLLNDIGLAKK
jgi:tripartite-type tricarboxylate transporter receptor subunit TctC